MDTEKDALKNTEEMTEEQKALMQKKAEITLKIIEKGMMN